MSFQQPTLLFGLILVPLLLALYVSMQTQRRGEAGGFGNPALLPNLVTARPGWRRHVPVAFVLAAVALLVVGIARPERTVLKPKREATVMLVTDVSGSMNATDVKPDRLAAAQGAARSFVGKVPPTFNVGFVAFNQYAELRLPPTTDRRQVGPVIDGLQAEGGTAMGDGLQRAVDAIEARRRATQQQLGAAAGRPPAAIILLSDGANTSGVTSPEGAGQAAARLRIPIYTVALGTPDGTITLQGLTGVDQVIRVPPDPTTLRAIARTTGGRFYDAIDSNQLESIYEALGTRIGFERDQQEITIVFVGAALLLLLLGAGLGTRWFGRPV